MNLSISFFLIAFNNLKIYYIILSIFILIFELFEQKTFNTIILNSIYQCIFFESVK